MLIYSVEVKLTFCGTRQCFWQEQNELARRSQSHFFTQLQLHLIILQNVTEDLRLTETTLDLSVELFFI